MTGERKERFSAIVYTSAFTPLKKAHVYICLGNACSTLLWRSMLACERLLEVLEQRNTFMLV